MFSDPLPHIKLSPYQALSNNKTNKNPRDHFKWSNCKIRGHYKKTNKAVMLDGIVNTCIDFGSVHSYTLKLLVILFSSRSIDVGA